MTNFPYFYDKLTDLAELERRLDGLLERPLEGLLECPLDGLLECPRLGLLDLLI